MYYLINFDIWIHPWNHQPPKFLLPLCKVILSIPHSHPQAILICFFFNWSIVGLQCCVNFCYTAKWLSYTYIYSFPHSFPLCFVTGYWIQFPVLYNRTLLFIHSLYHSLHLLIADSQFIHLLPPSPLATQVCSLWLWVSFCFVDKFTCVILDSTFVISYGTCLSLTYFT